MTVQTDLDRFVGYSLFDSTYVVVNVSCDFVGLPLQ